MIDLFFDTKASFDLFYIVTPPPVRGAEYCDDRVCLCVCLSVREHISGSTRPIFTNILHVTYVRGSGAKRHVLQVLWMTS